MMRHSVIALVIAAQSLGCHWIAPLSGGAPDSAPPDAPAAADGDRRDRGPADTPGPNRDIPDARLPDSHVFDAKLDTKPLPDTKPPDTSPPDITPSPDAGATTCTSFLKWSSVAPCSMTDGCSYSCSTPTSTYVVTCDPDDPTGVALCRCTTNGGNVVLCGPRVEKNSICYYPCNYWATLKPCCLP